MRQLQSAAPSLETTLLIAAGVILAVIMALLLAQADSYQRPSAIPSIDMPIVDPEATVAAGEMVIVYLPNEVNPTPPLLATPTQIPAEVDDILLETTSIEIKSTCSGAADDWSPYIVTAEDSLTSLAAQFNLSVNAIVQGNCLSREQIIPGQQLALPQDIAGTPIESECQPPPDWAPVTVSSRDTLSKLARAHGTTVYRLMEANCLKNANLMTGRTIFLPLVPPGTSIPKR